MRSKTKLQLYTESHQLTVQQLHSITGMSLTYLRATLSRGITTKALATKFADSLMEKNIMLFYDGKHADTNRWGSN